MENKSQKTIVTSNRIPTSSAAILKNSTHDLISFSGRYSDYCVCFVDMVDPTKITAQLSKTKACMYYATFLNAMAKIVTDYGGNVVKNVGDSLLYYFSDENRKLKNYVFSEVLHCGLAMIESHNYVNELTAKENLPPVQYRISADYGIVMIANQANSKNKDIFGIPVNLCAKINHYAKPMSMVIGGDLFQIVKSYKPFHFIPLTSYSNGLKLDYPVYSVIDRLEQN